MKCLGELNVLFHLVKAVSDIDPSVDPPKMLHDPNGDGIDVKDLGPKGKKALQGEITQRMHRMVVSTILNT